MVSLALRFVWISSLCLLFLKLTNPKANILPTSDYMVKCYFTGKVLTNHSIQRWREVVR